MEIGKRIQKYRKQAGLTQKQLAEKLGIVTGTMQQYELGKRQPRLEQLKRIADVLNVSWLELVDNEDDRLSVVADFAFEAAEEALNKFRKKPHEDLFVEMFNSDILQELGRRGIQVEERQRKRICELNKQEFVPLNDELFEQRVRDHIVILLYKHDVFPKDTDSLMSIGYTAGNAYYMMELTKLHDDNVGTLPPDYFDRVSEMATMIDLSVKYDDHSSKAE